MFPSISHITWLILTMYTNILEKRIRNEMGIIVVTIFHLTAQRSGIGDQMGE